MTNLNRRARIIAAISVAVLLLSSASIWVFNGFEAPSNGLFPVGDPVIVAEGRQVYARTCAACHGADLKGEPDWQKRDAEGFLPAPPHDETGHSWHHNEQLLFNITKFGLGPLAGADYKTRMPAYEGVLSDDEIIAVLTFIKSKWPPDLQTRHDQLSTNPE